jgi:folate-binding protein YgfZ
MTLMHADWEAFLAKAGAVTDDTGLRHFGEPRGEPRAAARGTVIADLSYLSLIGVQGADAASFLQGQLSNDIFKLNEARSHLSAYCNAQGRISSILRVIRGDAGFILLLPSELRERVLQRLRMYVLRAKVTLQHDQRFVPIGISGPAAATILREQFGSVPAVNERIAKNGVSLLGIPGPHARYLILADTASAHALWSSASKAIPVGTTAWSWLEIVSGLPRIYPQTYETFVPQMVNLDLLGGISFDKGCYSGQEIIARLHYLGKLKQRMFRAHIAASGVPAPADPIHTPGGNTQAIGHVVDATPSPSGGCDLLAVINVAAVEGTALRLGGLEGPALTIGPLPYAVT